MARACAAGAAQARRASHLGARINWEWKVLAPLGTLVRPRKRLAKCDSRGNRPAKSNLGRTVLGGGGVGEGRRNVGLADALRPSNPAPAADLGCDPVKCSKPARTCLSLCSIQGVCSFSAGRTRPS